MNNICKYETEAVKYVNKLVNLLYNDLEECSGGLLHIVLDDGNGYHINVKEITMSVDFARGVIHMFLEDDWV